jgi:glycosyltransferase involved in cell wall biosynthesis
MNILQVNTDDISGGAAKVAWDLFSAYRLRNHTSWLAVGLKTSSDPDVVEFPHDARRPPLVPAYPVLARWLQPFESRIPGVRRLRSFLLSGVRFKIEGALGWEDFDYPHSRDLLKLRPSRPDVVHAHNLHGRYFDLRSLAALSHRVPTFITLHDEWMLTGHCAYTLGCQRWESGCGQCPDLSIYPALRRDGTAYNWRRKRRISTRSQLHLATPSRWLADRVNRSMLSYRELRVVPNGVDLSVYHPDNRQKARAELGLPVDAFILLFVANNAAKNPFKDYTSIEQATSIFAQYATTTKPVVFVALGSPRDETTQLGNATVRHIRFERNPVRVARYYQAADVDLHAARAENFPCTVLEALACGTPVIATAVGGIPEQIEDGVTGFLTPPGDATAMAARIAQLLANTDLCQLMATQAAQVARQRFDLNHQVDDYLNWYQEILEREASRNALSNIG